MIPPRFVSVITGSPRMGVWPSLTACGPLLSLRSIPERPTLTKSQSPPHLRRAITDCVSLWCRKGSAGSMNCTAHPPRRTSHFPFPKADLWNAKRLVRIRIVHQRPGREPADVDDELRIVGTLNKARLSRKRFPVGERLFAR